MSHAENREILASRWLKTWWWQWRSSSTKLIFRLIDTLAVVNVARVQQNPRDILLFYEMKLRPNEAAGRWLSRPFQVIQFRAKRRNQSAGIILDGKRVSYWHSSRHRRRSSDCIECKHIAVAFACALTILFCHLSRARDGNLLRQKRKESKTIFEWLKAIWHAFCYPDVLYAYCFCFDFGLCSTLSSPCLPLSPSLLLRRLSVWIERRENIWIAIV